MKNQRTHANEPAGTQGAAEAAGKEWDSIRRAITEAIEEYRRQIDAVRRRHARSARRSLLNLSAPEN